MFTSDRETAKHYIKTFSDTAREPFLVLDPDLSIVGANESFYKNFQVTKEETNGRQVYDIGDGQWNIPKLRTLLENILPEKKVFNDYEVSFDFPKIGKRIMLLNARQLDDTQQILLAIEDITLRREIEERMAAYTKDLEKGIADKTGDLITRIDELSRLNAVIGLTPVLGKAIIPLFAHPAC